MAKDKPERRTSLVHVRIEDDLRQAIDDAATAERRPIANLIRNALRDRFCNSSEQPARHASA